MHDVKAVAPRRKKCLRCKKIRAIGKFCVDRIRRDGYHPYCTPCKSGPYLVGSVAREARHERIRTRTKKPCARCKVVKSIDHFHRQKRALDGHASLCKPCVKVYAHSVQPYDPTEARKSYLKRRHVTLPQTRQRRHDRRLELILIRGGRCVDCGLKPGKGWPASCFDFHHIERHSKEFNIANLTKSAVHFEKAKKEALKCVILCANCHRRRHHRSSNGGGPIPG